MLIVLKYAIEGMRPANVYRILGVSLLLCGKDEEKVVWVTKGPLLVCCWLCNSVLIDGVGNASVSMLAQPKVLRLYQG